MPPVLPVIRSRQNARVRELRAALAARRTDERIAIEGPHLLAEALLAAERHGRIHVETVFVREDQAELLHGLPPHVERLVLASEAFESASATGHSQGVAALLRYRPQAYSPRQGDLLLVCAGIQDPGNLGTLIRSAEAFGAAAVVLTGGTVDAWNGKALRASAGSTFRMPLVSWSAELHASLQQSCVRLLAAVPSSAGSVPASDASLGNGCALVIGNEGSGVPEEMLQLCDGRVTLPMHGETESLNAAVAGSVLLYEASRQRG